MTPFLQSVLPLPGPRAGQPVNAQFLEGLITMTHGAILLTGFVVVLVVAALLFLDKTSEPPVVPDENWIRGRQLENQWSERRGPRQPSPPLNRGQAFNVNATTPGARPCPITRPRNII